MEKTNMPQGKIGPIVARPPESETGEYEKIKEQIILASNTGEAVTYEMPKTREPESLRMGLNPLLNKAGFLTVHIRQTVAPTRDKDKNKLDGGVDLLWADPSPRMSRNRQHLCPCRRYRPQPQQRRSRLNTKENEHD